MKYLKRKPDFIIERNGAPYLKRWHIIPRNPVFNIYLHQFCQSDEDRALHDHPWLFNISILLKGSYIEHLPAGKTRYRRPGLWRGCLLRLGRAPHRIELFSTRTFRRGVIDTVPTPCWTLFMTGPRVRQWGFYCPQGWRHWKIFSDTDIHTSKTGRGCE